MPPVQRPQLRCVSAPLSATSAVPRDRQAVAGQSPIERRRRSASRVIEAFAPLNCPTDRPGICSRSMLKRLAEFTPPVNGATGVGAGPVFGDGVLPLDEPPPDEPPPEELEPWPDEGLPEDEPPAVQRPPEPGLASGFAGGLVTASGTEADPPVPGVVPVPVPGLAPPPVAGWVTGSGTFEPPADPPLDVEPPAVDPLDDAPGTAWPVQREAPPPALPVTAPAATFEVEAFSAVDPPADEPLEGCPLDVVLLPAELPVVELP